MRVVHFTMREGLSTVFLPQVVRPMSMLRKAGFSVRLLVGSALGDFIRPQLRRRWVQLGRQLRPDLELERLVMPPARFQRLWADTRQLMRWLRRQPAGPLILHCRGSVATRIALSVRSARPDTHVIFDCRGLAAPEYLYGAGLMDRSQASTEQAAHADLLESGERAAALTADAVVTVSEALKSYVVQHWQVPEDRVAVVPCCTDTSHGRKARQERAATRTGLGLDGRWVIAYSGSLARWQMPDESLQLFRRLQQLRPNAHLLLLTPQPEDFRLRVAAAGIDSASTTILSLPHQEVSRHLAAADCALLIRESCLVNKVASPIKLAEYLASGVPVIASAGIGDCDRMLAATGTGVVLPALPSRLEPAQVVDVLSALDDVGGSANQATAMAMVDWQSYLSVIANLWSGLAGSAASHDAPRLATACGAGS